MVYKKSVLRIILIIPTLIMGVFSINWLIAPATAANNLGMPLLDGLGRSTQIAALSAFFSAIFVFGFLGIYSQKSQWLSAAGLVLCLAFLFRSIAYLCHDAALAIAIMPVEAIFALIYFLGAYSFSKAS